MGRGRRTALSSWVKSRGIKFGVALFLPLVALGIGVWYFTSPRPREGTGVGMLAPDFSLERLDTGDPVSLSDFRGKGVLLLFWQSTCPDCRRAMPYFQELLTRYRDQGLVVLGVCLDHEPEAALEYLRSGGYELIPLWGSYERAMGIVELYEVPLVPYVVLIDRKGIIRFRGTFPEVPSPEEIERWL